METAQSVENYAVINLYFRVVENTSNQFEIIQWAPNI